MIAEGEGIRMEDRTLLGANQDFNIDPRLLGSSSDQEV